MRFVEAIKRAVGATKKPARVYAHKGPVYDARGDIICVLARDVYWCEAVKADHFAWPKASDGDRMPAAIDRFVNNVTEWTQERRNG